MSEPTTSSSTSSEDEILQEFRQRYASAPAPRPSRPAEPEQPQQQQSSAAQPEPPRQELPRPTETQAAAGPVPQPQHGAGFPAPNGAPGPNHSGPAPQATPHNGHQAPQGAAAPLNGHQAPQGAAAPLNGPSAAPTHAGPSGAAGGPVGRPTSAGVSPVLQPGHYGGPGQEVGAGGGVGQAYRGAPAADNGAASLKRQEKEAPKQGWQAKAAKVIPGLSKGKSEIEWDNLFSKVNAPYGQHIVIVVIGGKGSAGKTVDSLNLGTALAENRMNANVVAVTIDPSGNIHRRIKPVGESKARSVYSLAELYREARHGGRDQPESSRVSALMLTNSRKLSVLGPSRADSSPALTVEVFEEAMAVLREQYSITIIDTGNDPNSPVYHAALAMADVLVAVTSMEKDQLDGLTEELDNLKNGGWYQNLTDAPLIVFNSTKRGQVDINPKEEKTRLVQRYPGAQIVPVGWDQHVHRGDRISPDSLDKTTHRSFLKLAAAAISRAVK